MLIYIPNGLFPRMSFRNVRVSSTTQNNHRETKNSAVNMSNVENQNAN